MKAARILLLAAALGTPVVLASPAGAEPCNVTYGVPPYDATVVVCATQGDCLIYQNSGSEIHLQQPVCITLRR